MQLIPGAWAVHPIRRAWPSPATPNICDPAGPMDALAGEAVLLRQAPSSSSTTISRRLQTAATRRIRRMLTRGSGATLAVSFILECGTSTTASLLSCPPPSPSTTPTSLSTGLSYIQHWWLLCYSA
ncbi:hypothetical protein VPH35_088160 [Triticum aestivum]